MLEQPDLGRLDQALTASRNLLKIEADAIARLWQRNADNLATAIRFVAVCKGRIIVSGLGKSGHVGKKMTATLASLGTPTHFMHAAEALHGDLGMCGPKDVGIVISYSGKTEEVVRVAQYMRSIGMLVISMSRGKDSPIGQIADVNLDISVEREADPLQLAPTASALATMALGDALAVGVQTLNDFQPADFRQRHPGGPLGVSLAAVAGDDA